MAEAAETKDKSQKEPREYNPHVSSYLSIAVVSLVSFVAVTNLQDKSNKAEIGVSIAFGATLFALSVLIMLFDRIDGLNDKFDFKNVWEGKLEGYTLVFFFFWSIAGAAFMTRVGGVAYNALNIYFSAWINVYVCGCALNEWTSAKDIISIKELTRLSATLKSWYTVFCFSLVVLGSAADAHRKLKKIDKAMSSYLVAVGAMAVFVSMIFILAHYKLITCCKISLGGWLELFVTLLMNIWFVIAVAISTQDGEIAATITGDGCASDDGVVAPGSNLYFSLWGSLISSCFVTFRWKAAQAIQFAHAGQKNSDDDVKDGSPTAESNDDDEDAI